MFDFFSLDGFTSAFTSGTSLGPDADASRSAAYTQGLKVLEMQQSFATAHLDQLTMLSEVARRQSERLMGLQAAALKQSVDWALDAQKSTLDVFKPAEA